jgi:hypothetical protein
MCFTRTIVGVAAATCLAAAPALADSQHGHSATPQTHATAPKSTTPPTTSSTTTRTTTTTSGATKTTTPMLNPIAAKISAKPQLNTKVTAMLPKNMTLDRASEGFKNQGQFIAALHVSKNVGVSFKDLKNDMTKKNMSLGQSIQDLKKSAASKTEANMSLGQSIQDLKSPMPGQSIGHRISSNLQLNSKVQALLPSGMTLSQAAKGFTSESQFLAALHASKDLNIPFARIKTEMTGSDHDSLTRAIQELKPAASATTAAKTAQNEAAADIKSTHTSTLGNHDGNDR